LKFIDGKLIKASGKKKKKDTGIKKSKRGNMRFNLDATVCEGKDNNKWKRVKIAQIPAFKGKKSTKPKSKGVTR